MKLLSLLIVLLALPAYAQPIAPKNIPLGRKVDIDHEILKCYSLSEYMLVLDADNELTVTRKKVRLLEAKLLLVEEHVDLLNQGQELLVTQRDEALKEVKVMTGKWEKENLAKHEAEAGESMWRSVALGGGAVTIVLGIALAIFAGK